MRAKTAGYSGLYAIGAVCAIAAAHKRYRSFRIARRPLQ
jgi:hypothetical protein